MTEAPHIWTRRLKIIEPKRELILPPRLSGWIRAKAIRPDGRVRVDTGWFPNLITDTGLNLIGTSAGWVSSCAVGTGNAAPADGDTALASQVAVTTNRTDRSGASNQTADRYCYGRAVYRFSAGAAAGNLAEVGIFGEGSVMFSRALILDGSGEPTTLTILSDEALDVTYEVRTYPPLTDVETTMMIGEDEYDITVRASEVDLLWDMLGGGLGAGIGWSGGHSSNIGGSLYPSDSTIGSVTGSPSGTAASSSSGSSSSYASGSYVRDFSYTWNLTSGNVSGGAGAMRISCGGQVDGQGMAFQIQVSPPIPKNSGNNLTMNFRQSWARRSI